MILISTIPLPISFILAPPLAFHCLTQEKPNPNEPGDLPSPLTHTGHGNLSTGNSWSLNPVRPLMPPRNHSTQLRSCSPTRPHNSCVLTSLEHPSPSYSANDLPIHSTQQMKAMIWGLTQLPSPMPSSRRQTSLYH